jgi:hypothetical protein
MQDPASYNLDQVIEQVKAMKTNHRSCILQSNPA